MAAAVSQPDDLDEASGDAGDDADEDLAPERVSFFAADELAAATSVWRLYLRSSAEHGHEDPKRAGQLLARARLVDTNERKRRVREARPERACAEPQPEKPNTEAPMEYGELKERVRDSHASLRKELGRYPTNVELTSAVGKDASVEAVRATAKRLELVLEDGRSVGAGQPRPRKSAGGGQNPTKRRPRRAKANGNGHTSGHANGHGKHAFEDMPEIKGTEVGASLAIMALQTERTRIESELAAIDKIIARFRAQGTA